MQEVRGFESLRLHPIDNLIRCWQTIGFTLGGLVAGEGSFFVSPGRTDKAGDRRLRFRFQVTMASRDRGLLAALGAYLGVGSIHDRPSVHGWLPASTLAVNSHKAHRAATIPFAERFVLPGAKRDQFLHWRDALDEYETRYPNRYGQGPSPCSVPGCGRPVRGRGLCRSHYYRATGY